MHVFDYTLVYWVFAMCLGVYLSVTSIWFAANRSVLKRTTRFVTGSLFFFYAANQLPGAIVDGNRVVYKVNGNHLTPSYHQPFYDLSEQQAEFARLFWETFNQITPPERNSIKRFELLDNANSSLLARVVRYWPYKNPPTSLAINMGRHTQDSTVLMGGAWIGTIIHEIGHIVLSQEPEIRASWTTTFQSAYRNRDIHDVHTEYELTGGIEEAFCENFEVFVLQSDKILEQVKQSQEEATQYHNGSCLRERTCFFMMNQVPLVQLRDHIRVELLKLGFSADKSDLSPDAQYSICL